MTCSRLTNVKEIIDCYRLEPLLPEGGWFRRFWFKEGEISQIYYLLTGDDFSEFHFLPQDEQYLFLSGDPVEHYTGNPRDRRLTRNILGLNYHKGELRDIHVDAGSFQASRLKKGGEWALMCTTMAPPFRREDYRSLGYGEMIEAFPEQSNLIKELTRF